MKIINAVAGEYVKILKLIKALYTKFKENNYGIYKRKIYQT